ncbi:hypothetical protein [Kalamiella sp. sgz302252]|uniref:hypothetical protein n=1 Tax=Pantoea sp. sgz302252 TaxID=3341827 RepID=UPI0036D31B84
MIDISALDKFKNAYLELLDKKMELDINKEELYLEVDYSIVDSIQHDINNLNLTINLFLDAKRNNDELAIQAALLRMSTFLSSVSGVLEQTRGDIDRFVFAPDVAEFPENYKIPEHYNYFIK